MFAALNSFLTGALAKVTDVYWPFVSMLLHGDGVNGGQNNTFLDGSTNNFTVTRNGNTTQGSFNPFVSTYPYSVATNGGSAYFDGTGDYLTVPNSAAYALPSDYTIEFWWNPTTISGNSDLFCIGNSDVGQNGLLLYYGSDGTLRPWTNNNTIMIATASAIVANTWCHIALVRSGSGTNNTVLYVNGISIGSATNTTSFTGIAGNGLVLNAAYYGVYSAGKAGYISNFRVVKGTAVYTTTFTPPTAPLTAVTNTALLLGMSNGAIYDNTMLNNLETVADAQISTSVFKYGTGSMKFDGTGDYLLTPNKTLFSFGTGDFTIEMWVYPNSFAGYNTLIEARSGGTVSSYGLFIDITTGKIYWYDASGVQLSSSGLTLNAWAHVAVSRTSGVLKLFIAGVQVYSAANTNAQNPTGNFVIGRNIESSPIYFNGYIDDLRVTKGIGRYTATFTPPTAAFPNLGPTYPSGTATQRAMFAFGTGPTSIVNLVSNTGVVAGDTSTVATARAGQAGAGYGGDKAIFAYGYTTGVVSLSNLVSNTGVVAADTTGVGTARYILNAASYGSTGQAIFAYGYTSTQVSLSNLVSSTGVIATDTTGVGTTRSQLSSASYGTDKAIFAYGWTGGITAISNLVSNTGVVGNDVTGVGTARLGPAGASYGGDKAIIGYGNNSAAVNSPVSMTNLVSNTGVVASDTTGVGTARSYIAAASYGGDKAIFGYGYNGSDLSMSNLVSNTGVVATDTTGVGTARNTLYAANYSYS
jgi:hypothetical protein